MARRLVWCGCRRKLCLVLVQRIKVVIGKKRVDAVNEKFQWKKLKTASQRTGFSVDNWKYFNYIIQTSRTLMVMYIRITILGHRITQIITNSL
jgi:hypothetical protein